MTNQQRAQFQKSFGRRVRQLREERGVSQKDLARKAKISNLSQIERGSVAIQVPRAYRIADALEVDPSELFPERAAARCES